MYTRIWTQVAESTSYNNRYSTSASKGWHAVKPINQICKLENVSLVDKCQIYMSSVLEVEIAV